MFLTLPGESERLHPRRLQSGLLRTLLLLSFSTSLDRRARFWRFVSSQWNLANRIRRRLPRKYPHCKARLVMALRFFWGLYFSSMWARRLVRLPGRLLTRKAPHHGAATIGR